MNMIKAYITHPTVFPFQAEEPWTIVGNLCETITRLVGMLGDDYEVKDGVAIHRTATIGHNVTVKAPAIISADCFVGSNSYLRGGVFLAPGARGGISCEVRPRYCSRAVPLPISTSWATASSVMM